MRRKRAYIGKRRKSPEEELQELLSRPRPDSEHRQMLAWLKQEQRYGRLQRTEYTDWLEQNFGRIEDANDSWLTETTDE